MNWNWQEALSIKYSREEILKDLLKDQSLLFEMAKEDVAKILQKTNYNFIVRKLHYNEFYALGLEVTKKQVEKILERKKYNSTFILLYTQCLEHRILCATIEDQNKTSYQFGRYGSKISGTCNRQQNFLCSTIKTDL